MKFPYRNIHKETKKKIMVDYLGHGWLLRLGGEMGHDCYGYKISFMK